MVSSEYSITSGLGNIWQPERDTFIRLVFMQLCTFIKMRLFWQFFLVAGLPQKNVLWYRIYLLLVNWCCHSVEPCALMCPFKGSQGNSRAFFFIKQNTPQGRSEVVFDLLLLLETLVSNSCLRVYYVKSIWIWFLGFRPESKWVLAVNYSSRQCRAPTN